MSINGAGFAVKIGIIGHVRYAIREPFSGGLEMHTHLLSKALRARGHDVTVFCAADSDTSMHMEAICSETDEKADHTDNLRDSADSIEHRAYQGLMNELCDRSFDIIHNNSLHYIPIEMSSQLSIPMVTTLHTPPFPELVGAIGVSNLQQISFVAVSRSVQREWSRYMPIRRVIPNGIDLAKFAFSAQPDEAPYLVWYGRIVPEKGLHLAIEAARIAGFALHIAGPISDEAYFRAEVQPRLNSQTIYLGHLTHRDLAKVIGGARAFLCTPCWEEPYGLVVAEALACGTPVAAFARGAMSEILDASCGVLVLREDPVALAQAALSAQYLSRPDCRARATGICDASHMIGSYESLYSDLLGRQQARGAA